MRFDQTSMKNRWARYCSRECQKAAWVAHKPHCVNIEAEKQKDNTYIDTYITVRAWADAWVESMEAYSLFAANLANQPENYLQTHR